VRTCISSAQILRTGDAQLASESLRLFDVSLFRLVPIWMKRRVYADGNWFLAGRFGLAEEMSRIFEHNLLLGEMAARLTVVDGPPTLKFVHSLSTHTPWVLADDCRSLMRTEEKLRRPQTRCALLALGDLLEALAAKGVYDRTEIFVLADHGMGRPNEFIARASQRSRRWARRAGSANPLFLMKPRRAHGPIADDPAPVYLPDLGATACACVVGLSTLFTKQHYILDVVAGFVLAFLAYVLFLRKTAREDVAELERRLAPALVLVVGGIVFLCFCCYVVLYMLGVEI